LVWTIPVQVVQLHIAFSVAWVLGESFRWPWRSRLHGLARVELVNQCLEVDGEGVVVVARRGLARVPKPSPVVSDHALAGFQRYETDRPNQPGLRQIP